MPWWAIALVVYLVAAPIALVFMLGLCYVADKADRMMGYKQ